MGVSRTGHYKGAVMAGGTAKKLTDIEFKAFAKKAVLGSKLADGGGLFLFYYAQWRSNVANQVPAGW